MPLAGEVFPEWYWTPILFLVHYSPALVGGTAAIYLTGRRHAWFRLGPTLPRRLLLAAAAFAVSTSLTVVAVAAWEHVSFERAAAAEARALNFTVLVPAGYDLESFSPVVASHANLVQGTVAAGGERFFVVEQLAGPVDVSDRSSCEIHVTGTRGPQPVERGPCTVRLTPGGATAVLVAEHSQRLAYLVRDGTLVQLRYPSGREADALVLLDALEPVAVDELDFER